MSLHSFSFSHRATERKLKLESIQDHRFIYGSKLLEHMFTSPSFFVEMGGVHGISYALRTDTQGGLRDDELAENFATRRAVYGSNTYPLPPIKGFWNHVIEGFVDDMMLKVLLVAGIVSIATGTYLHPTHGWVEGFAILICVAIVLFVGAFQNHKQEVEYRKLAASLKGAPSTVIRGGKTQSLEQNELLVGDIVILNPGNMIPADGIIIDNTTVKCNESALTGESDEKSKNIKDPFMAAGTELVDGSCSMLITATGVNSAKGKLMAGLAIAPEPTDLQKRLEASEKIAGYAGLVCGVFTFTALMIKFAVTKPDWSTEWSKIIQFFITSISIVLCSIPEGLPLAVTISMAYSMQRMRDDQNLVKVLSACETMGNATTICSDKTGTLTQNKMTVVQSYIAQQYYSRQPQAHELSPAVHKYLVDGIILNSDKRIDQDKMNFETPHEDWTWVGEGGATETALLSWLSRYYDPTTIESEAKHNPNKSNIMQIRQANREKVITFYPFSSAKKYSATVLGFAIPDPSDETKMTLPSTASMYFKGAADRIIQRCTKFVTPQGQIQDIPYKDQNGQVSMHLDQRPGPGVPGMCGWSANGESCDKWALLGRKGSNKPICCADPRHKPAEIPQNDLVQLDNHPMKVMDNMTRQGLRCIAFAFVENVPIFLKDGQLVEPDYGSLPWVFVGVVGIKDPLRLETKASVMTIQQAGIVVRMVTGDNLDTARFIARDCGIISSPRHVAVEGVDFRQKLEENEAYKNKNGEHNPDFVDFITNLRVMARCHPEDKLELVKFLKTECNQIVGVTGDGSNDSPALKASNVGLAMGIAGTDVAKAAADIIILDDNFNSIVRSVMWGRSVFDSIRKFLQFQLSVNMSALLVALIGALALGEEPLKALQLLWINLVMDTMGALAIGTEKPKSDILYRKPYVPGGALISKIMFRNIIGQAVCQIAILLPLVFLGQYLYPNIFFTGDYNPLTGEAIIDRVLLNTFIFNTFTFMQLFNEINSRKCNAELNAFDGIFTNLWFPGLWVLAAALQVILVQFCGVFMSTTPLNWILWLTSIAIAASQLVSGFILKLFPIDVDEGQISLDRHVVFEGAEWLDNKAMLDEVFKQFDKKKLTKKAASTDNSEKDTVSDEESKPAFSVASKQVYIGNAFYAPVGDEEGIEMTTTTSPRV